MKGTRVAAMAVGTASGAVLMALAVAVVFGLKTGIGGAALMFATVAVAGGTGFLMGRLHQMRVVNKFYYQKGLQDGLAKNTIVIREQDRSYSVRSDVSGGKDGARTEN